MARFALCLAICVLLQSSCRHGPPYYLDKGNKLFESGKYSEASLNYRKAVQQDPKLGIAYFRLGLSERKQQHYPAAWENLNRAATLLPSRGDVKIELGELCLMGLVGDPRRPQNLYNQLKEIASQLLANDSSSFAGLRFQGYIGLLEKRADEAAVPVNQ